MGTFAWMLSIDPKEISTAHLHGYLLGAVAPRPICFASTIDSQGNVNLSPFSFFNVFSANPPVMVFSPARRVRDNTTKHTLENVREVPEVVINIVTFDMVQQMSLSSTEYDRGVNEFIKSGFMQIPSEKVKPPRVAESPVQFECSVNQVIELGEAGGAGNLIVAEVVRLHLNEAILDDDGKIDPFKIDTVARLGGNWYSRSREGLFEVEKPIRSLGIGVDGLPDSVRLSTVLTGNDLGMLGNIEQLPAEADYARWKIELEGISTEEVHRMAQKILSQGKTLEALQMLMAKDNNSE